MVAYFNRYRPYETSLPWISHKTEPAHINNEDIVLVATYYAHDQKQSESNHLCDVIPEEKRLSSSRVLNSEDDLPLLDSSLDPLPLTGR